MSACVSWFRKRQEIIRKGPAAIIMMGTRMITVIPTKVMTTERAVIRMIMPTAMITVIRMITAAPASVSCRSAWLQGQ